MQEGTRTDSIDLIKNTDVVVEVGPGHSPGVSIIDKLERAEDIKTGKMLYVAVDDSRENLQHVRHGAVSHISLEDFALTDGADFLNGKVGRMYIFNVFGEPYSSASIAGFSKQLFGGLIKKLSTKGQIVICEHITPRKARFLLDAQQYRDLGVDVLMLTAPYAIKLKLESGDLGFSPRYVNSIVGQGKENVERYGQDDAPFLLILTKR